VSREARIESPLAALPRVSVPRDPAIPVAAAALLSAALVGVALAADVPVGIALLVTLCYLPLLFINLRLGFALWIPLVFLQGVPALRLGGEAAGLLIVVAWFGAVRSSGEMVLAVLHRHRGVLVALAGLLIWLTLSLTWADDPGLGSGDLEPWYALAALFVVTMTTVITPHAVRLVAIAFVVGAVLSVCVGVLDGSLTSAVDGGARFEGGGGDPNFLAASIVAAAVIAAGLLASTGSPVLRLLILLAIAILIAGLVGSASRGGALAAGVTIVAALVVFKDRRAPVLAVTGVIVGIATLIFANAPGQWERTTNFDDDNGRSDLWTVAWEMGKDNPVVGVGLHNFRVHSPDYVQEPGQVEQVGLIVETHNLVHNTYLQLFAEGGVVAVSLFLALVAGCLRAAKRAADLFELYGERSLETLARSVLVATISMLAAAWFLSATLDLRLWLLLALGPGLLAAASRRTSKDPGDKRQTALVPAFPGERGRRLRGT
jgi:O-antigen ligase